MINTCRGFCAALDSSMLNILKSIVVVFLGYYIKFVEIQLYPPHTPCSTPPEHKTRRFVAYDLLLPIPWCPYQSDMNGHPSTITHETEKGWVASTSARISIYIVNPVLPITIVERTVEDSLSKWNELFQAEESLVNHKPLHQRLTYARIEWSWRLINENERQYTTEDVPSKVVFDLSP